MAKRVMLDVVFTFGGSDRKADISSISFEINREEVDVSTFGAKSDQYELGKANWSLTMNVRPDADQAFRKQLLQRMEDGADVAVIFRPTNAAEGPTNPTLSGNVKVSKVPNLGGDHGALEGEGSITLKGNGAALWDDGTTEITIG